MTRTGKKYPSRGFGSMDKTKQREIAAKGGRAAHAQGVAHTWTAEEARSAGRKGGQVSSRRQHPDPLATPEPAPESQEE